MITQSGVSVWPKGSKYYSETAVPSLEDIGWGLGRIVRFGGQTKQWYNVLLHSITVSKIVTDPRAYYYALLHDAPEAIVSDVVSTWKGQEAKERENELLELITLSLADQYSLEWPWPEHVVDVVAEADHVALAAEAHVLGHAQAQKWWPRHRYADNPRFHLAEDLTREYEKQAVLYVLEPKRGSGLYMEAFGQKP